MEGAGVCIQEGVEETERRFASGRKVIVDQSNDAGEDGARAAGTLDTLGRAADHDLEYLTNGGDVGVRTTGSVEFPTVSRAERGEESADGAFLVRGLGEVVGEASGGETGRGLSRAGKGSGADGGHASK